MEKNSKQFKRVFYLIAELSPDDLKELRRLMNYDSKFIDEILKDLRRKREKTKDMPVTT